MKYLFAASVGDCSKGERVTFGIPKVTRSFYGFRNILSVPLVTQH
jgi:hypothetical protein